MRAMRGLYLTPAPSVPVSRKKVGDANELAAAIGFYPALVSDHQTTPTWHSPEADAFIVKCR